MIPTFVDVAGKRLDKGEDVKASLGLATERLLYQEKLEKIKTERAATWGSPVVP